MEKITETIDLTAHLRPLLEEALRLHALGVKDKWSRVAVGTGHFYTGAAAETYLETARNLWNLLDRETQEALATEYGITTSCRFRVGQARI